MTSRSSDGILIVYDRLGEGPALIKVEGALCTRWAGSNPKLVNLLARHYPPELRRAYRSCVPAGCVDV
jgi:hypothetical protein